MPERTEPPIPALQDRTIVLLAAARECVEPLPAIVDDYTSQGAAIGDPVGRLQAHETHCNEVARGLRVAIGDSAMQEAFFFPAGELVSLVGAIDGVANRAERVATSLTTIDPMLPERCGDLLHRMAETAVVAFEALATATTTYVEALAGDVEAAPITEPIEQVRSLESDADDLRRRAVRAAFADAPTADALAVRAVVHEMESVHDGIETAADTLDVVRATWG